MTDDIVDLIDSAVRDCDAGPDAVRYNGPQPAETEGSWFGGLAGAEMIRAVSDFERQMVALQQSVFVPAAASVSRLLAAMSATFEPLQTAAAGAHESMLTLVRTLRLEPWPHGWERTCFCHPAPFPAASDYRRRTKHRNRRRRR